VKRGGPGPMRAKRLTAHQKRMCEFEELMYQTLRKLEDGLFDATSGVAVGALSIAFSTAFDLIKANAESVFGKKKRR
jgi:hypothetical protein